MKSCYWLFFLGLVFYGCGDNSAPFRPTEAVAYDQPLARMERDFWDWAISPNGSLALLDRDGLKVYGVPSLTETAVMQRGGLSAMDFSPDGNTLAVGAEDGKIYILDDVHLRNVATLDPGYDSTSVLSVTFSPDGKKIASMTNVPFLEGVMVDVWKRSNRNWTKESFFQTMTDVSSRLAFSPDGRSLAFGSPYGVIVWEYSKREQFLLPKGYVGLIVNLSFSPDGRVLVVDDLLSNPSFWNIGRRKEEKYLPENSGEVQGVAVKFEDGLLAWTNMDSTMIHVWDFVRKQEIAVFRDPGNYNPTNVLEFSPDGKFLLSIDNGGLSLWDATKFRQKSVARPVIVLEGANPSSSPPGVRYEIPREDQVDLAVLNENGQNVQTLVSSVQSPGSHTAAWDGRDETGRDAASGVYFYRLRTGEQEVSQKMVLVK